MIKLDKVRGEALTLGLIVGILVGGVFASVWFYAPSQNLQNQITQLQIEVNSLKIEADKIVGLQSQITSLTNEKTALQNQLVTLNSQITSLQSTLENKNQEITGLTSSYSELNNEYQNLLTYYNSLLEIYSLPDSYTGNYENLSSYLETDPDNSISVTDTRVNWDTMDRSLSREAWSNYEDNSRIFIHQFRFNINQIDAGDGDDRVIVQLWMLSSNDDQVILYASQVGASNNEYNLVFFQRDHGNNIFVYYTKDYYSPLNINEEYIARITRNGEVYRLQVYSLIGYELLIDSGNLNGLYLEFNKLSLANMEGYSVDLQDWSTGYIEYLQFLK